MAASSMRGLINHSSRSKHKFCRKHCPCHYPALCISARWNGECHFRSLGRSAKSVRCYLGRRRPARTQRSNSGNKRENKCMAQLAAATSKQLIRIAYVTSARWPLSSTQLHFAASPSHVLSAPAPRCRLRPGTPQAKRQTRTRSHSSDQRTIGRGLHIPTCGGVERRHRVPATGCSELHYSAWTPLRRILPHRRSYKAAGVTASVTR